MNNVSRKLVRTFVEDPLSYAMLMEDHEIEETIAKLMTILYHRKNTGRGD
jgi:hypothetical protein